MIEKRREAEEALQESVKRYRMLFDSANDAVFVHQPNKDKSPGKFIQVNEVASRIYGYSQHELLEMTPLDLVIPEQKDEAKQRVKS